MSDDQRHDSAPTESPQDPSIVEHGTYAGDHAQRNDVEPDANATALDEDRSAEDENDRPTR